ncbi:MAG: hypothetical protein R2762_18825, partial [Bryobacteraceae bacterium]
MIVFGALTEGVFRPDIRTAAGTHRFLVFLACFVGWSTFWVAVRPAWLMPLTVALAGAWMALTGGAGAVLTVIGLALACRAVGRRIDPNPAISIAMGCAVLILSIQGLAWLPVNTPAVYITLIAAPIALDHPELRGDMAVIARRAASVDRW